MKKIAIFCRSFEEGVEPFTSDYYWQAYQDLYFALKERGLDVYFATDNNTYEDYGCFSTAYTICKKIPLNKIHTMQQVHDVQVDMVFDRGAFIGRNVPTVNPAIVQKIGMNKTEMFKYFAEYQPVSFICHNADEIREAFAKTEGDKVVVKEPKSFGGGKGVFIGDKKEVINRLPATYPLLVQEFLDTSAGVPGYMTGVHDVRLTTCGGKIIGCYIRQAKEGSLHSNVSKGGKMIFFEAQQTPRELIDIVEDVDTLFARHPRYYSIDFMYTPKGWKMLEINPYLALLPITDGIEAVRTLNYLADYLTATCNAIGSQRTRRQTPAVETAGV
jgi:glutathione synthase/RimK-type ligase-like ATP-grasp enzyme